MTDTCQTPGCGHPKDDHHAGGCGHASSDWYSRCPCTAYLPTRPVPEEALCVCGHRFHWPATGYCHECGNTQDGCHQYDPATVPAPHAEAEAAWIEAIKSGDTYKWERVHDGFIAGYLRGRGDRG